MIDKEKIINAINNYNTDWYSVYVYKINFDETEIKILINNN